MSAKTILSLSLLLSILISACGLASLTPAPVPTVAPASQASTDSPEAEIPQQNLRSTVLSQSRRIEREITYCTMDGVALKADVYFPQEEAGILLIYIHGGGWRSGSRNGGAGFLDVPALLQAGYTLASIDYRLAPEYKIPDMVQDVKCAVRYFRVHAAEYGIAPDRIGVWGTSAGGHLASMLGTADKAAGFEAGEHLDTSSRVQAVVSLFGPANLQPRGSNPEETSGLAAISPIGYISPDDPPFLLLHGDADTTVAWRQSQEFYDRLTAAGVEAQLVIVKGGNHGLTEPDQVPGRAELTQMIVDFFDASLR
jgi:acetyl esterase/lipase